MAANDFTDDTPPPNPAPKKIYRLRAGVLGEIPWPAGQTFQQALAAALPGAIRNRTNGSDFVIHVELEAIEL